MSAVPGLDVEDCADVLQTALRRVADSSGRVRIDPETVEQDLARLVLCVMEFLRQVMELQAIRRVEAGSLSAEEEEALGQTLMQSAAAIRDMAGRFGLKPEDLTLDLGPLGRLV